MPTYDYVCRACEHRFEHFQSMQDPTLRKCPACGRQRLERLIGSGAGILFKGTGFYETDYKRKSPGGAKGSGSGEASDAAKKPGGAPPDAGAGGTASSPSGDPAGPGKPAPRSKDA